MKPESVPLVALVREWLQGPRYRRRARTGHFRQCRQLIAVELVNATRHDRRGFVNSCLGAAIIPQRDGKPIAQITEPDGFGRVGQPARLNQQRGRAHDQAHRREIHSRRFENIVDEGEVRGVRYYPLVDLVLQPRLQLIVILGAELARPHRRDLGVANDLERLCAPRLIGDALGDLIDMAEQHALEIEIHRRDEIGSADRVALVRRHAAPCQMEYRIEIVFLVFRQIGPRRRDLRGIAVIDRRPVSPFDLAKRGLDHSRIDLFRGNSSPFALGCGDLGEHGVKATPCENDHIPLGFVQLARQQLLDTLHRRRILFLPLEQQRLPGDHLAKIGLVAEIERNRHQVRAQERGWLARAPVDPFGSGNAGMKPVPLHPHVGIDQRLQNILLDARVGVIGFVSVVKQHASHKSVRVAIVHLLGVHVDASEAGEQAASRARLRVATLADGAFGEGFGSPQPFAARLVVVALFLAELQFVLVPPDVDYRLDRAVQTQQRFDGKLGPVGPLIIEARRDIDLLAGRIIFGLRPLLEAVLAPERYLAAAAKIDFLQQGLRLFEIVLIDRLHGLDAGDAIHPLHRRVHFVRRLLGLADQRVVKHLELLLPERLVGVLLEHRGLGSFPGLRRGAGIALDRCGAGFVLHLARANPVRGPLFRQRVRRGLLAGPARQHAQFGGDHLALHIVMDRFQCFALD